MLIFELALVFVVGVSGEPGKYHHFRIVEASVEVLGVLQYDLLLFKALLGDDLGSVLAANLLAG